jgi:hypothetical protein
MTRRLSGRGGGVRAPSVRSPNASGACPDLFVEGQAVRELRRTGREHPSPADYRGHERITVANLEDDDPGGDV